jgi:hypothetical protein
MDVSIRALTVCQPHAFFIVADEDEAAAVRDGLTPKRVENRNWATNYRGQLLIHAGRSRAWLRDWRQDNLPPLVYGAFIGIAELVDCIPWDKHYAAPDWMADHPHADVIDVYWWVLSSVRRFAAPVPWTGKQGLWRPFSGSRNLHNCAEGRLLRQAISTARLIEWSPDEARKLTRVS